MRLTPGWAAKLLNKLGELINPATEETLSQISSKQDTANTNLTSIIEKLERLRTVLGDNLTSYTASISSYDIRYELDAIRGFAAGISDKLSYPGGAETYTTTPLGANATYYSPTRDFYHSRLRHAGCIGFSDQASVTDGVQAQLSIDGSNWDYTGAKTTAPANQGVSLEQTVTARYVRFVWMNGGTAQSVFRFGGRYYI